MWWISDNSALSSLAEMGWLELLPKVLGPITIPASVAAEAQEVEIEEAMERLIATGFRISQALLDDARAQVAARKSWI